MAKNSLQILLVEDNPADARLLRELLREVAPGSYEVTVVQRVADAREKLTALAYDLVLTDLALPDASGLQSVRELQAAAPAVPVVVLSGVDDEAVALNAVREGAQDYLLKNHLDAQTLARSIRHAIERHVAEQKLVSSEAFYHSLVEHLPQNIFRKDLSERFTFANQRFCQLLGRPLDEIIGRTDFDLYPEELARKFQKDDREVIATGRIFETIEENLGPDGDSIYVHVVKSPIRDVKGQVLGTQCIFWDITAQKRFEQQLQRKNEALAASEAALRKSNEDLKAAQLQLIQAEKMESIGTLAAGVAHEVKNPLAILQMGVTYLAKKQSADESVAMVLQEMREAISRADAITRGLLDFAASKQISVKTEDFNQLIADTLKMVRHELGKKRIELVTEFSDLLPKVAVDKTQIQQVFVNLFVNAVHAMPDGGTLKVRTYSKQMTETTHSEGSRSSARLWLGERAVVAEVEDSGTGIPKEHLAKIFDPFFTTKPTGEGTGLGLPVSKKIIELHGGTLDIKNKAEGNGVRATVLLREQRES